MRKLSERFILCDASSVCVTSVNYDVACAVCNDSMHDLQVLRGRQSRCGLAAGFPPIVSTPVPSSDSFPQQLPVAEETEQRSALQVASYRRRRTRRQPQRLQVRWNDQSYA